MKLSVEHIQAQGFRVILGEEHACLLGPDGRRYHPRHKVMVGMIWAPAHEVAGMLLDAMQRELETEIEADKRAKREQWASDRKRKPARRPPRRRGKRSGPRG